MSPSSAGPPRSQALPIALLVGVTVVWGSTFVIVKDAVTRMPVMDFLAWRFGLAALVMVAIRPRALLALPARALAQGVVLGGFLGAGYITQTFGLEHTSAAISGFLTGMFVVFTPLLSGLLLRRRIPLAAWGATALAGGGLAVISLTRLGLGEGEGLTLLCAACFALQIVGLGEWSAGRDPYGLCAVQLLTAAFGCIGVAAGTSGLAPPPDWAVWGAVFATAVLATAVAFLVQTWAQAHMAPTRVAIVLTMEPVFAGLFAALAGEHLSLRVLLGGAMVLTAMYLAELAPGGHKSGPPDEQREEGTASAYS